MINFFLKIINFLELEYEKFLIKSGITAPQFEANIIEQEKRRQFLSSLAGGIVIPETLIRIKNLKKKIKLKQYNISILKNTMLKTNHLRRRN